MVAKVTAELCSWTERSASASPSPLEEPAKIEATISATPSKVASATGFAQRDSRSRISALPRTGRTLQAMPNAQPTPVVPLEAGAGPENPPCPACGEPLFGWIAPRPGLRGVAVSRCESCGLGVAGEPGAPEDALRELDRLGDPPRICNRASFAASLGGAGWAGLEGSARYLFTLEAARRLVARRDQVVKSRRWAPGASVLVTWQTLLNSVTFGHGVALGALGRAEPLPARKRWQRRIDALASFVLALPAFVIALPIELAAGLSGRGAVISLRFDLL